MGNNYSYRDHRSSRYDQGQLCSTMNSSGSQRNNSSKPQTQERNVDLFSHWDKLNLGKRLPRRGNHKQANSNARTSFNDKLISRLGIDGQNIKHYNVVQQKMTQFKAGKKQSLTVLKSDIKLVHGLIDILVYLTGFKLQFDVVPVHKIDSHHAALRTLPGKIVLKVTKTPSRKEDCPWICSVKGFYVLFFFITDLCQNLESSCSKMRYAVNRQADNCTEGKLHSFSNVHSGTKEANFAPKDHLSADDFSTGEECPICLDRYPNIFPPCGHGLCGKCFHDWYQKSKTCPVCRVDDKQCITISSNENDSSMTTRFDTMIQTLSCILTRLPKVTFVKKNGMGSRVTQQSQTRSRLAREASSTVSGSEIQLPSREAISRINHSLEGGFLPNGRSRLSSEAENTANHDNPIIHPVIESAQVQQQSLQTETETEDKDDIFQLQLKIAIARSLGDSQSLDSEV